MEGRVILPELEELILAGTDIKIGTSADLPRLRCLTLKDMRASSPVLRQLISSPTLESVGFLSYAMIDNEFI